MKYGALLKLLILFLLISCFKKPVEIQSNIIPAPLEQIINEGVFRLDEKVNFVSDWKLSDVANYFESYLKNRYDLVFSANETNDKVYFKINESITNEEGYLLSITPKKILIEAKSQKGAFYAVQTLLQLIPIKAEEKAITIQCLEIKDEPRFKYRGMHLDVARHMYSVDFIKKYIDLIASLKMNTFHWHLTEDQGWRIEIKKHPKLQEIAAYRKETLQGHYSDQPHQFDGQRYGGYYTHEQIKDIVAYAQERQVTIIPEIEMPGHSQAAIAAYPELGCTGKKVEVATKWGVFDEVYCPKESTFTFLEDVIDEVVALFPGKYIHIGGDEAPKTRWKKCKHCQALIKREGLKDEHGLQSYFIQRMEKYINSKGKQIIGWDEILEGGLAPNATVMSWRGVNGAVEAAKEGHDVILTPTSHCYFDYYQSDNEQEPLAIGGFLPLEKAYSFNPIPEELTESESKYVLGAQGNVWTEYMPNEKKVEYMTFPRAIALSEVVWSSPENKNYNDFIKRLEGFQKRLDYLDVNYANHLYEVKGVLKNVNDTLSYELNAATNTYPIYYSVDGTEPTILYSKPILIDSTVTIKAGVYEMGLEKKGNLLKQKINIHKGVGAKITLNKDPHPSYNVGGKKALINGISGNNKRYGDKEWLGFSGDDIEVTIEFDKPTEVNSISTRFHNGNGQWIYAPKELSVSLELYGEMKLAKFLYVPIKNSNSLIINHEMKFEETNLVRKISIKIPNYGIIPEGKQGAGHKAWTFIDEIIIE